MKDQIRVSVSGGQGCGKTTVLSIIERALEDRGFSVEVLGTDSGLGSQRDRIERVNDSDLVANAAHSTSIALERVIAA